jgi:hypothetical protein
MKLQAGQDCNLYNEAQHNVPGLRIVDKLRVSDYSESGC